MALSRHLVPLLCLIALPAAAQSKGTPLPGLKEKEGAAASTPAAAQSEVDVAALKKKADSGDAEAQLSLADLMLRGAVKGAKAEDAAALLEKAADAGHPPAQLAFARMIQSGAAGRKPDPERARFLIQQAAESGLAAAQTAHALILMGQVDLKSRDLNYDEPVAWFRKAADQGDTEAMCRLGMMQAVGQGMPADPAAAWKLISKAARAGNALALNEAGIALQQGRGVEQDPVAAIGYFHAAADLGNVAALVNLGSCYRSGNGIPRDLNKAGAAFAAAARANSAPAQLILGEMFERGEGTEANPVYAAVNYLRAANNGFAAGKERFDALKPSLSAAQLKEVEDAISGKAPLEQGKPAKPEPKESGKPRRR